MTHNERVIARMIVVVLGAFGAIAAGAAAVEYGPAIWERALELAHAIGGG